MKQRNRTILIVDDDANDRALIELAFKKVGVPVNTPSVNSGHEALRYLRGEGPFADRRANPFPDYIISDLKMAEGDGLQLLKAIKSHPVFCVIPVIILSGSSDADDIKHAFQLGVTTFFTKCHAMGELIHLIRTISEYWNLSEMPGKDENGRLLPTKSLGKLGEVFSR